LVCPFLTMFTNKHSIAESKANCNRLANIVLISKIGYKLACKVLDSVH
jgi:hypothetical protein